jgi:hypothetical protein
MYRLLTGLLAAAATTVATISNCGTTSTRFQLTALDFQPAAPAPGDEVFMTVEFQNPGATIADGTAHRTVTLNGLPVVDETVALCNEATTCPLATGFNNRSATSTWPDVKGKIVSTVRWFATDGEELLCIKTAVSVAAGPALRGHLNAHALQHLAQPVFVHSTEVALRVVEPHLPLLGLCPVFPANQSVGAPEQDESSA